MIVFIVVSVLVVVSYFSLYKDNTFILILQIFFKKKLQKFLLPMFIYAKKPHNVRLLTVKLSAFSTPSYG